VVGDKSYRNIVGPHALGRRNQMLINLCERITNIWFKKPKRKFYIWKAPRNRSQHQLEYILMKHRFRNSMKDVQTMHGADIDSDHNLLTAKFCTRLKKIIKTQKGKPG
jgi:endonuclease/exonuclease/phosphatase family metal-dependent hydrolase